MILERFIEACVTGETCRHSRNLDAISRKGLALLAEHGLWDQAANAVIQLDEVHPLAKERFIKVWRRVSFCKFIDDDDLLFAFLRKVFPLYDGESMFLFRGQCRGERIGASWTFSPHIAFKFALFGARNIDPFGLVLRGPRRKPRENAIIMKGAVPASSIIFSPHLWGELEGEYIIDPRGIEFTTEPAEEAAGWVRDFLLEGLQARENLACLIHEIRVRHGFCSDDPIEILTTATAAGDLEAEVLLGSGLVIPFVAALIAKRLGGMEQCDG